MTFVQSRFTFGGYVFPYGMRLDYRQSDQQIDETPIPFQDGTNAQAGMANSGTLAMTGIIGGSGAVDSVGDPITTVDELEAELQLMKSWLGLGYQQFTMGLGDTRYCYAQKSKFKATLAEAEGGIVAHLEIEFLVQDPRWINPTVNSLAAQHHGSSGATAAGGGSAIVYPTCTITGPGQNPTLTAHPGSASGSAPKVQLNFNITLGGGDTLQIDCDPRNRPNAVLLNGSPALYTLGTNGCTNTMGNQAFFPYMLPGPNRLVADPDTSGGAGGAAVWSWQDGWYF